MVMVAALLLIVTISTTPTVVNGGQLDCGGVTKTGVDNSAGGKIRVEYFVTFNQEDKLICVTAKNTGELNSYSRVSISVDGKTVDVGGDVQLQPNESVSVKKNITGWIDVTAENHTVAVGTYAGTSYFNFTQKIDESREGGIPSPYITDIEVIRNQSSGNAYLEVIAVSRAERLYHPSLVVKTFETDTTRALPSTPDNDTLVYNVELEESASETVAGDIKLYEHWKFSDGKFDRKEFVSQPDGSFQSSEPKFEDVPSVSEMNAEIYYENESARKYRDQGPDVKPISETASRVGAVLTVLLLIGGLWYRHRRKYR